MDTFQQVQLTQLISTQAKFVMIEAGHCFPGAIFVLILVHSSISGFLLSMPAVTSLGFPNLSFKAGLADVFLRSR